MNRRVCDQACGICGDCGPHSVFAAREMMFGTRESFDYLMCESCGCLQIVRVPIDLARHYPSHYFAHAPLREQASKPARLLKRILHRERCRTALFDRHYKVNRLLKHVVDYPSALYSNPNGVSSIRAILTTAGVDRFDVSVLDVGCGAHSAWLAALFELGFSDLLGIDPLIPKSSQFHGFRVLAIDLKELDGKYDLITLHHSLEHIANQGQIMREIIRHLSSGGVCVIRIPIVSSYAWRRYQTNWVELDAPRHLYIHSVDSIKRLARDAGMTVFATLYDSLAFEFYGSEMYARDIALTDENSPWINPQSNLFSKVEMQNFRTMARQANERGEGGRAAFFMRRSAD